MNPLLKRESGMILVFKTICVNLPLEDSGMYCSLNQAIACERVKPTRVCQGHSVRRRPPLTGVTNGEARTRDALICQVAVLELANRAAVLNPTLLRGA